MKLSSQEEYGLRCLLHIARQGEEGSVTIPEISRAEGISQDYVAKLMRILRQGGMVESTRGQAGGYSLARPANEIFVSEVVEVLGGRFFEPDFCDRFAGVENVCTHSVDCSIRWLWQRVQEAVDQVLSRSSLDDLLSGEKELISIEAGVVSARSTPVESPLELLRERSDT